MDIRMHLHGIRPSFVSDKAVIRSLTLHLGSTQTLWPSYSRAAYLVLSTG
jgi:hypothetical protein